MKYLNIFTSIEGYENDKSGELLIKPNVSLVDEDNSVRYLIDIEEAPSIKYEYVDLGLPSGLKWAKCNVGAASEADYGLYFMWGETEGHIADSGYNFSNDNYTSKGLNNISTNLTFENDAAYINMGGNWRIPTKEEFKELIENTNSTWVLINDTNGLKFTSKTDNSKYIFMPAAGKHNFSSHSSWGFSGYYWSSTINGSSMASTLNIEASGSSQPSLSKFTG